MKRVLTVQLLLFAACCLLPVKALAISEICPAQLRIEPGSAPASLYAFELAAFGPRTVSATLAFDTSDGWFTADVPAVNLVSKYRHYSDNSTSFAVRDWISPMMYVRFPKNLTINHRWVFRASAKNDGDFGWEKLGDFGCPPPAPTMERADGYKIISRSTSRTASGGSHSVSEPVLDVKDGDNFQALPGGGDVVLNAVTSPPLEVASCANPFQDAAPHQITVLAFPQDLRGMNLYGMTILDIVLHGDGKLADTWVWGSSGNRDFDLTAMAGAQYSTYTNAIAYCKPVPAIYRVETFFDS